MDEFCLEVNSIFYLKWMVLQGSKYNLKIFFKSPNIVVIKHHNVEGTVEYYGNGLFEQKIISHISNEIVFYLHFKLNHLNHAIALFEDMIDCMLEVVNRPFVRVLLCCSGGLTTTLFANRMEELAKLKKLFFQVEATGYSKLSVIGNDYDIILLAPQISYLLPRVKNILPNKHILVIPTKIFAMNDYSGALEMVTNFLKQLEYK